MRPSVVLTLITSANWVIGRIQLPLLTVPDHLFAAVQTRVIEQLGAETRAIKEAPAIPLEIIKILEESVTQQTDVNAKWSVQAWFYLPVHGVDQWAF